LENPTELDHLEYVGLGGMIILKRVLKKEDWEGLGQD
jgi:hypothetical protein